MKRVEEEEKEEVEEKDEETITNEGDSNITIINNESIEYPFGLVAVFLKKINLKSQEVFTQSLRNYHHMLKRIQTLK